MVDIICPYRGSKNRTCSHKRTKKNRGGKRYCNFKWPHNCDLFAELISVVEEEEKSLRMAKNA